MVDGQTVKTRTLYRYMVEWFGAANICAVDTLNYHHEAARVTRELIKCLHTCDVVVVLLSNGGRRALFAPSTITSSTASAPFCRR